jgi:hypothetical protein
MATDTVVVPRRKDPRLDDLVVGAPGRAVSHLDTARLLHWVRGRGRTLVPYHIVNRAAAGSALTLRYSTNPSGVAIERIWVVTIRGGTSGGLPVSHYDVSLEAGSGGVVTYPCRFAPTLLYYRETGCTKTAALTEITIEIDPGAKSVIVEGIACYELPRVLLTPGAPDYGVHLDSFYPRRAIYSHDTEGLDALAQSLAQTDGRRIGLISWAGSECSTTSTSFVDAFEEPIPVTPRRDRTGTTQLVCTWGVYAKASNGTTAGEFQLTAASGDVFSVFLPLLSTSYAWIYGSIYLDSEDLASADGDAGETVRLEVKRTAGAGSVIWDHFDVWEDT